jgi:alpha-beta hydrolase superfamily lysophospholipase
MSAETFEIAGREGAIVVRRWSPDGDPRLVVLLAHGYGEHSGRYEHVAARLNGIGALVYAPDHLGHGASEGERALMIDGEALVDDLDQVRMRAEVEHPDLPMVLIGHSMGGLIATRLAQRDPSVFEALVLSGPAIGANPAITGLLAMDPIPEIPIDPTILSRDPAVGEAYMADELVYHGPYRRATLASFARGIENVKAADPLGPLPTLWMHGTDDMLIPIDPVRETVHELGAENLEEREWPGARHEIFNETNNDEVLDHAVEFIERHVGAGAARA